MGCIIYGYYSLRQIYSLLIYFSGYSMGVERHYLGIKGGGGGTYIEGNDTQCYYCYKQRNELYLSILIL